MPYAWGSRTAIAELRGLPAAERPEAELWMGAHPLAPSRAVTFEGERSLTEIIADDPHAHLGAQQASRFGGRLSFLMKVLAADEPLSLQAHPSREQARAGFAREEAAKVPIGAANRSYKDENHKPELLCALGPFEALSGFRDAEEARTILRALDVASLAPLRLSADGAPLRDGFAELLRLDAAVRVPLVQAVAARAKELAGRGGPHARAYHWAAELAVKYPGDAGVVSSLLLRHVELAAGEAIFLPAGNLHAYLRGVGIEIMASSDNVLRGGLTPKHVDVEELLSVLDFDAKPPVLVTARSSSEGVFVYPTPAPDFELSRIEIPPSSVSVDVSGAEILFCAWGAVTLRAGKRSLALRAGATAFVPASTAAYVLEGTGTVFRATAGR
jgi:mannose-6-phosphate isomerase